MDPALGPLPIADFSPGPVFGDDFHRQVLAQIDPVDRILNAGAGAQVHFTGAQADIPGQRQPGALDRGLKGGGGADQHKQAEEKRKSQTGHK